MSGYVGYEWLTREKGGLVDSAPALLQKGSGFESRHPSNGQNKERNGKHTLVTKKIYKKIPYSYNGYR
jgi:hypothetical protein